LILLDTHVVIWLAQDYQRVTRTAQAVIKEARKKDRGLAVSCITLVEIARLGGYGRVNLTPDLEAFLSDVEQRFIVLPITANISRARRSNSPPGTPTIPWIALSAPPR